MERVTIKDIASELNIAVGTVSKALNGKPGISDATREAVIATSQRLGYNANKLAQSLARKPVNIGIVIPAVWPQFYGYLRLGIDHGLEALMDYKVNGNYTTVSALNATDEIRQALRQFLSDGTDAVIICSTFGADYEDELQALKNNGIPVIILGNRLQTDSILACVGAHSSLAGAMAADFGRWLAQNGSAAVFIGKSDVWDHAEKAKAFSARAQENGLKVCGVFETLDQPNMAYALTEQLARTTSDLRMIYVATGNSLAVCKCLTDLGLENRIKVIATDIFPELQPYIQSNIIEGVIFQDPVWQGKTAVHTLYDYLTQGITPPQEILTYPHFVLKSNFNNYLD